MIFHSFLNTLTVCLFSKEADLYSIFKNVFAIILIIQYMTNIMKLLSLVRKKKLNTEQTNS